MNTEETAVTLERHEQLLYNMKQDIAELREVQTEIRAINETLVTLATEMKHTNEHLARHERKIDEFESRPKWLIQQVVISIIAAVVGGLIGLVLKG